MAGNFILLTGGTGHVGYRTLIEALSKGYQVRAAVRSEAKIAEVKNAKSSRPYLDKLSFIIVPDIETPGAFDKAVEGVDYVVHIASPIARPSDNDEVNIIQPAVRGTLSILQSALQQASIRKVVITASVASVSPSEEKIFTADNVEPDPKGPYPNTLAAYAASKKLAYNRTLDFMAKEKPHFSIVHIMPSFVIGRNELATTAEAARSGSNRVACVPIFGIRNPAGMLAMTCHVDDVAFLHVAALEAKVEGNQNFGVNTAVNGIRWDDALEIVKKHFPSEVEKGIFPLGGSQKSVPVQFDATPTEKFFGIKFRSFEEQVVSLAGHYAEVVARDHVTI
jgi:nucleoside-diphosphate-sugar epimerase